MQCTNIHKLPPEVYACLTKERYSGDDEDKVTDYSATSLVAPTQQVILKKRYPGQGAGDAIDRVWVLFGHIAHALLEEHGSEDSITEKRFYRTILGRVISGQSDHYKDRKITDYKSTSVYKLKKKDFDDWTKQLNIYAFLHECDGYPVDTLRVVAICKDWRLSEAYEKDYPTAPIVIIPILKWSLAARTRYITERVQALIAAESKPDALLPECTPKEKWQQTTDWAIIRPGRKTAVRRFPTKDEAVEYLAAHQQEGDEVRRRFSPARRCLNYCSVKEVCCQFRKEQAEIKEGACPEAAGRETLSSVEQD
jgi:hypothetical protein